jgi:TnpA family transposase
MPRREFLTAAQREAVLAFPEEEENLLRYHTLSIRDLATVRRHRGGDHNRLGFAVQLCYLRYPGPSSRRMKRRRQHCSPWSRHS